VSARGLFLLFYVGITGLLSASVFGLVIVRDGELLFYRKDNVRLAPYQRSYWGPGEGSFLLGFILISCISWGG
jgi:hypothetical protein